MTEFTWSRHLLCHLHYRCRQRHSPSPYRPLQHQQIQLLNITEWQHHTVKNIVTITLITIMIITSIIIIITIKFRLID